MVVAVVVAGTHLVVEGGRSRSVQWMRLVLLAVVVVAVTHVAVEGGRSRPVEWMG